MSADKKGSSQDAAQVQGQAAAEAPVPAAPVLEDDGFVEEEYKPGEADGGMFGAMPAKKASISGPLPSA
jgi:ATP-binding cassette subfamily B protein